MDISALRGVSFGVWGSSVRLPERPIMFSLTVKAHPQSPLAGIPIAQEVMGNSKMWKKIESLLRTPTFTPRVSGSPELKHPPCDEPLRDNWKMGRNRNRSIGSPHVTSSPIIPTVRGGSSYCRSTCTQYTPPPPKGCIRRRGGGLKRGGGRGFGWGTPPPWVPLWSPPKAGRKLLSLNLLGPKGAEVKFWLSASDIGRGGGGSRGVQGGVTPPLPAVYGRSNTSLPPPPLPSIWYT